jgi:copper chaperone CopZ
MKATISLPTIHCESCTKLIGMTLKSIPGITKQTFDIDKKTLVIKFDASTSGQAIINAIVNETGYEAKLESEEDFIEKNEFEHLEHVTKQNVTTE